MNLNKFNYNSQRIKDYIQSLTINFDQISFHSRTISNILNQKICFKSGETFIITEKIYI